ncbi:uncharacterized protein B0J16DRAFT_397116 [Fusarium flagelliforme]|uniref:Uncharacterized protein n=1 Tax=Fusarium flagelliforme TaxID=2675880 RepID=A0A395N3Y3_9HYPO|nr:uncharacterized protein B0J16DRAFT_397116 [Fusarium flagelliforme]KAH7189140.1 hypothetical protein B0J16DRAFT_397116 [Fusarium flagelliforme]RFN54640.1 hypothetical protein FIE12Z_1120 [Fusarium flagelliforme]
MRLSLPFVALCAIPAAVGMAIPGGSKDVESSDYNKHHEQKHHGEHHHDVHKDHEHHKHKHNHLHPYEHIHHVHHKHPIKPCHILTKERVCKDFRHLTNEVEKVIHVVKSKDCGNDEDCWKGVVYHIYKLEHRLDVYDKEIDYTTLQKCFGCDKEHYVVDCYLEYANALIRLLKVLKHKSKHLEGEVDRPVLTSINSLRSANYAVTYEIGRRIKGKKALKTIMEKQGANDGSTKGSVMEAFNKFTYTPLITGNDFENKGSYDNSYENKYEGEKKDYKHHNEYKKDDYKHGHEYKHGDGYEHDEYKKDDYKHDDGYKHKHDEYKRAEPHYNHLSVRDYRDPRFVDKDNYSLEPSNDHYVNNPYGVYRDREREEAYKGRLDEEEREAMDIMDWRRNEMRRLPRLPKWERKATGTMQKWYSPSRSPYNHHNGNHRWAARA